MPTILLAISHHGFGHLAQLVPVIHELCARQKIKLVVYSAIPRDILNHFLYVPGLLEECIHIDAEVDINMQMIDAVHVDVQRSFEAYAKGQRDRKKRLSMIKQHLREAQPDLIIGNVPPLLMRAGDDMGIQTMTISSLDWAGVFSAYCGECEGAEAITEQLYADYACADHLLALTPGMGFSTLLARQPQLTDRMTQIGPVARIQSGEATGSEQLRAHCGLAGKQLVLVSMGGMPLTIAYEAWPHQPERHYIIASENIPERDDMTSLKALPFSYLQILKAADVFISKVGYGAMVEAAVCATPTLYWPRGDWPEEPISIPWYQANLQCVEIDQATVVSGEFEQALDKLNAQAEKPPVKANGAVQAVDLLQKLF